MGWKAVMKTFILSLFLSLCSFSVANAETYKCSFSRHAEQSGMVEDKSVFEMSFIVDHQAKKSYTIGNTGSSSVAFFRNQMDEELLSLRLLKLAQCKLLQLALLWPCIAVIAF